MKIKLYKDLTKIDLTRICLYFGEGGGGDDGFNYCYDVVNSIADYAGDKVDVWDNGAQKWYKRNNLGNYEPYGIIEYVNDLSSTTYYVGKLVVYNNHECERTNSGWSDLGELEGETAELPDVPFSINVNAKDYDSTTKTFTKTNGQLVDTDLTFTIGQPTSVHDDYITVPTGCLAPYAATYRNYFNRDSSNPNITIISKTANVTRESLISNRDTTYNWMYRLKNQSSGRWLTFHGNSERGHCDITEDPQIMSARVDSNRLLTLNNWTEATSDTYTGFTYGGTNNGTIGLFAGFGNTANEPFEGDFYWVYVSQNTLTDEQIQQVIYYNEVGTVIVYPKEYTERENPVVVLVFEDIDEANAYRDCVYDGQVALIDGEGYIMSEALGEWIEAGEVPDYLCFTAEQANSTFKFVNNGTSNPDVEYSTNGFAFSPLAADTVITLSNVGDKVYLRGDNPNGFSVGDGNHTTFVMTGKIAASGSVMSLIDTDNFDSLTEIPNAWCFAKLFQNCTSLTSAPEFTATVLKDSCYFAAFEGTNVLPDCSNIVFESSTVAMSGALQGLFAHTKVTDADLDDILPHDENDKYCLPIAGKYYYMFYGCRYLMTPPELPATTVVQNGYQNMFSGCSVLRNIPTLPATTLANGCYNAMFYGCTGLTSVSSLPATTLASYCYNSMFENCNSLTTAPALPATTLATYCYQNMFRGCTRLTSAPTISATTLAQSCCASMFNGCTNLTTAPSLPATTLAMNCYISMFKGCTSLTTAPTLPATSLATQCYYEMFYGCTSLTTAPALPATTLNGNYCYYSMFENCTSLTSAPQLPATTLTTQCYGHMFKGCTSLTTAPSLPATVATNSCYQQMFYGCSGLTTISPISITTFGYSSNACDEMFSDCTSLTTIPSGTLPALTLGSYCYSAIFQRCTSLTTVPSDLLPAQVLASRCYQYMFNGCSALTTAPDLPATTLVDNCYGYMFRDCRNLNYIKAMFTNNPNTNAGTSNWVQNVASSGTFVMNANAAWSPDNYRNANGVPANWTVNTATPTPPAVLPDYLCFTAQEANSTVEMRGAGSYTQNVEYTADNGATWNTLTRNYPITLNSVGDKVYLRGDNPNGFSNSRFNYNYFSTTGKIAASGNIMSLVSKTNFENLLTIPNEYYFYRLFDNSTSLTDAANLKLPATTLADYCYWYMFQGCTSLTTAPELPSTTLAYMCYCNMFDGCTSLTSAPALPATTLVTYCYNSMFSGCTSLTSAPELPATTLTNYCYENMFNGCTSLSYIKAMFTTTPSTYYTRNWVNGVASSGTFVYNSQITWNPNNYRNANGIPLNWVLEDENGNGSDEAD